MSDKEVKQQWELLASPGHVLLARVDAYRLKLKLPLVLMISAIALALAGLVTAPFIALNAGSLVGWIVQKTSAAVSSKAPDASPAPYVNPFRPTFSPGVTFDKTTLPKLVEDVMPAMESLVATVQKGAKFEDCEFTKKITEHWSDGIDMTPKCRYSTDQSRSWVWSVVLDEAGGARPFIGMVAKRDGKTEFYNVDIPRTATILGKPSLKPVLIPRTVASDFPELK